MLLTAALQGAGFVVWLEIDKNKNYKKEMNINF